jgi:ankyrin repeat protein
MGQTVSIDQDLLDACWNGDFEKVKRAIEEGADVNAKRKCGECANVDAKGGEYLGVTPLHVASTYGHKNIISLLLEHGADVNAEYDGGETPLVDAQLVGSCDRDTEGRDNKPT